MRLHTIKSNIGAWWGRRYFIHFNNTLGTRTITNELYLFPDSWGGGVNLELSGDCEGTISFHIRIPKLFSWYFSADCNFGQHPKWQKFIRLGDRKYDSREWGFSVDESFGCVSGPFVTFKFGEFGNETRNSDPKWLSYHFEPQEIICGKHTYNVGDVEITEHLVNIPGSGEYKDKEHLLKCKETISTWTWPRFKKPLIVRRFEVSSEEGVKHPGKGSQCYNCEESALYSSCGPANSKECAIQNFIDSVTYYRTEYPL